MIVEGVRISLDFKCYLVNVYAPEERQKKEVWNYLLTLMNRNCGEYVVFGDFNVVRNANERLGTEFCKYYAEELNDFMVTGELHDVVMGARNFTRVNYQCTKMSKLDRFLVLEGIVDKFPNIYTMVLTIL